MGIADKLGHAAEELKDKAQDAVHKVTGNKDHEADNEPAAVPPTQRNQPAAERPAGDPTGQARTREDWEPSVSNRDAEVDPMQLPAPNIRPNQDPTGKVEPGRR